MHADDSTFDNGTNGKALKAVRKQFPKTIIVSSFAFIEEAINTIDRISLVISTQNKEVFRIFNFIC